LGFSISDLFFTCHAELVSAPHMLGVHLSGLNQASCLSCEIPKQVRDDGSKRSCYAELVSAPHLLIDQHPGYLSYEVPKQVGMT
jgi:hypothetical protein